MIKNFILNGLQKASFAKFKQCVNCIIYDLHAAHLEDDVTDSDHEALKFAEREIKAEAVRLFECAYYGRSVTDVDNVLITMDDCLPLFMRYLRYDWDIKPIYVEGELNSFFIDIDNLTEECVDYMASEYFTNEENWRVL